MEDNLTMKILVKKDNKLISLGEGKLYTKNQLKLNEVDASLPPVNGIQKAQQTAMRLMNNNPNVNSASADAGKLDGQKDAQSGEGLKLEVPVNATGQQLAQAQRMTKDQSADDVQITFTKQQTQDATNESRILELRRNSIPFTKKELHNFLKNLQ